MEPILRTIMEDKTEIKRIKVIEKRQKEYQDSTELRINYAKILNEHYKKNNYGHQLFKKINILKKEEPATDKK
tara:strand:- start:356 stop:574 length:219 start_codon:yes stop_codon:yes gene_type:complete